MIKLSELLFEDIESDDKRIRLAYDFFIKRLGLPKDRISLKFGYLQLDPDSQLPTQANVFVSESSPRRYIITIRNNNPMSLDSRIRHLAHEMQHIKQVESGIFDPYEHTWSGVKYEIKKGVMEYYNLPWEVDARGVVSELELLFNRYMRDLGSSKKHGWAIFCSKRQWCVGDTQRVGRIW